jgi:hypothetical protein
MVGMQADMPSARCASSHNREDNPMTELKTAELFIAMDSDGDWSSGSDENEAVDNYNTNIGGNLALRVVKITVTMRPPEITEASVTVPNEAGQQVAATAE